jgi:hypothetical protein
MERRLAYLVDRLSLDLERTRGWAIAHAVAWDWPEYAQLLSRG